MVGTLESSFVPSFLFIAMALAIVNATFVCPKDSMASLELCNSTFECPVYEKTNAVTVLDWTFPHAADCRIVLASSAAVLLISHDVANVTPTAACAPWFAVGQPTSSSAAALRNRCSSARYRASLFFFPLDVVMTFAHNFPSNRQLPALAYQEAELRPLCTAVISLNSSSYVAPPLDFAGGGNCTSRLESPSGTAIWLSLEDSQPRFGDDGGLSSDCVCYIAEGEAATASRCLAPNPDVRNVGSCVTLTVKGDSAGLLCSAVILVTVSPLEPPTSVGKASRLCSCQLLLLLLLREATRPWLVPT